MDKKISCNTRQRNRSLGSNCEKKSRYEKDTRYVKLILIPIIAVVFALVLDFIFGDPKNRYHPTVWMGKLIGKSIPYAKSANPITEKINGTVLLVLMVSLVSILIVSFSSSLRYVENFDLSALYKILFIGADVILVGILLKTTIAIKGMEDHASKIMDC